jgi:putative glutamine amidotransferase
VSSVRFVRGGFALIAGLALASIAVGFSSCQSKQAPASDSATALTSGKPTTVVLSKFYSSLSYRNWLSNVAAQPGSGVDSLVFVEAYGLDSLALEAALLSADGILLTGGVDVHPGRYNQAADTLRCGRIDPWRDAVEAQLIDHVWANATPCLGVCRGLQILNVHTGGSLHPHLPDAGFFGHRGGTTAYVPSETRDTTHTVLVTHTIAPAGVPFTAGVTASVISHHHQGIDRLAKGWMAWAEAPGGLIEGIRWADTTALPFVVGVQWHPERSAPGPLSDPLGRAFLSSATN